MKKLIILLFLIPVFAQAQSTHTVEPKETLYSVARKYNVPPRELAAYNNLTIETGLTIGQVIKIPPTGKATAGKPAPVNPKSADITTTSVPVYHKVGKKETLYHISKLYPGASIDDIKKWNKLNSDGLSEGMNLIVGFKKEKVSAPVVTEPVAEKKPVVTEIKKEEPVKEKPVVVTETKPAEPVMTAPVKSPEPSKVTGKNFNGGYFKSLYQEQLSANKSMKEESGTAAVFKSSSGWEDGKYYCLHNTAPAGSIIKITNKSNQKVVYAKVLDVIPDLKQNAGIAIRLSNAAADELGAGENNFEALLNY
ncbi:MAG: LysM peptidoglycan-binding domain-containing protein [Bacteroidetes bacterium]|jgi:LysM repeat protein|nr:LysM peptidoglycan-binding domain-containing protein [Bacteroidota bacterium]